LCSLFIIHHMCGVWLRPLWKLICVNVWFVETSHLYTLVQYQYSCCCNKSFCIHLSNINIAVVTSHLYTLQLYWYWTSVYKWLVTTAILILDKCIQMTCYNSYIDIRQVYTKWLVTTTAILILDKRNNINIAVVTSHLYTLVQYQYSCCNKSFVYACPISI
jgi:hypothetical protein